MLTDTPRHSPYSPYDCILPREKKRSFHTCRYFQISNLCHVSSYGEFVYMADAGTVRLQGTFEGERPVCFVNHLNAFHLKTNLRTAGENMATLLVRKG
jgi:hypothetical protein